VCTGNGATDARSVEAIKSVSTGNDAAHARIVEALASVSTGEYAAHARIVEASMPPLITFSETISKIGGPQQRTKQSRQKKTLARTTRLIRLMSARTPIRLMSARTPQTTD